MAFTEFVTYINVVFTNLLEILDGIQFLQTFQRFQMVFTEFGTDVGFTPRGYLHMYIIFDRVNYNCLDVCNKSI
jgi:hypothetical protein